MSPLASETATDQASRTIVEITAEAHAELIALRDTEADADRLGLRLEVVSKPGEDFRYDLSFDVVTKAAFTDEVRTHTGADGATLPGKTLKVIVPAKDLDALRGATLDHTATQGLIIRNPNRPAPPTVEGLISGDDLSAEVETLVATEVNPALAADGGFVTYVGHDGEGTAYLTMGGGCHGCSMSRQTMLDGVQTMLVDQIEGVERVKDLTDHASGDNPFYS